MGPSGARDGGSPVSAGFSLADPAWICAKATSTSAAGEAV